MLGKEDISECEKSPRVHCPVLNLSAGKNPPQKKSGKKKKKDFTRLQMATNRTVTI